ncbi:tripartite tricarboxylate transporter TctB family protein [Bacillus sp. Marseille-P3661]|uniref:tripartite tricarboxylate transporter TctB family protein n=1 Tax=Bacillus sp. Marseille-P3661 TaxID=1936234 RepID=UPI000C829999|nr:tripartite tricarboxylate transporter TctB family protein [Bacillus sp. Marseille-P3661]
MNSNLVLSIITIVFSVIFFIYSKTLPAPEDAEKIGAGGWPSTILLLMFILGVWLLVRTLLEKKKETVSTVSKVENNSNGDSKEIVEPPMFSKNHYIVTFILVAYAIAVPIIGFLIATFLLVLSLAWLLGMKRKRNLAITSVASSLFFIYLFTIVLQLPLPRGWWLFREISLLFY